MNKIHLKENIFIGSNNGFITVHEKLVKGDESKNAGEEYFTAPLTYSNADYVVRGLVQRFDVHACRSEVLEAYNKAKREDSIEIAKMPKRVIGKKAGE